MQLPVNDSASPKLFNLEPPGIGNEKATLLRPTDDMVGFFCIAALTQGSMFSTVVSSPTGTNGYEEYVRAAEIAASPDFSAYRLWVGAIHAVKDVSDDEPKPIDVDRNDPDLVVRRKWNDKFKACMQLVSAGNQKPVYDPRQTVLPETLYPELAYFKSLAILEANASHVAFADGQTGEAINHIEDGLTFASHLGENSILVSRLVGIACSTIALNELDDHWPQLCLNDAQEVKRYLAGRLFAPPSILRTVSGERKAAKAAVEELFSRTDDFANNAGLETDVKGIYKQIQKLGPFDAQHLESDTEAAIDTYFDSLATALSGPESGWLKFQDMPDFGENSSLKDRLVSMVLPVMTMAIQAELKDRIHDRLAYLTAAAIEYHWINGRLPQNMQQFASAEERTDPSGGRYSYKVEGKWFKITREASDALGMVGIRKAPPTPVDDPGDQSHP